MLFHRLAYWEQVAVESTAGAIRHNLPKHPVFDDPWVKNNIAVGYGHKQRDGVGSQALRMLAIYALSKSLGIAHDFSPIECVGHIGNQVHYREVGCNFTSDADRRQLAKVQHMISLPATHTELNLMQWKRKDVPALVWSTFVQDVGQAWTERQPTLFIFERLNNLVRDYPDLFLSIPALVPSKPAVSRAVGFGGGELRAASSSSTHSALVTVTSAPCMLLGMLQHISRDSHYGTLWQDLPFR